MKTRTGYFYLSLIVTLFATSSVLGQPPQQPTTLESDGETCTRLYKQFVAIHRKNAAPALVVAREFLETCKEDNVQSRFAKKWVHNYEKDLLRFHLKRLIQENRILEAFESGKAILASDPNDFDTLFTLSEAGLIAFASGNKAVIPDAINAARKGLQLIETDPNLILEKEEEVAGWLNFSLGIFFVVSSPLESTAYFDKFAQCQPCKKDPLNYARLADAIWTTEYYPLQKQIQERFKTPEQKATREAASLKVRLFWAADLIVDALARAIALSGSNPRFTAQKAVWMIMLMDAYKYRNSGYDTGLSEFIEEALDEPFPRLPV